MQILTLKDEESWRATKGDPRANVDRAKNLLRELFRLSDKVLDDSFFKTFMRSFEPVFSSELPQMTKKVLDAFAEARNRENQKLAKDVEQKQRDFLNDDRVSSIHKVVGVHDLKIKDPKLLQFAKYLAHQTLSSEDKLSLEITSGSSDMKHGINFSLSDCLRPVNTQRSTQESDWIDEARINTLVIKIFNNSQGLDLIFDSANLETLQASDPIKIH